MFAETFPLEKSPDSAAILSPSVRLRHVGGRSARLLSLSGTRSFPDPELGGNPQHRNRGQYRPRLPGKLPQIPQEYCQVSFALSRVLIVFSRFLFLS